MQVLKRVQSVIGVKCGWKSHLAVDRWWAEAELVDVGHEGSLQDATELVLGATARDASASAVLDSLGVGHHRAVVWRSCRGRSRGT